MLDSTRIALEAWFDRLEAWMAEHGITRAELLEVWEEVTPTTPDAPGST